MRQISKCLNPKLSNLCLEAIKLEDLSYLIQMHLPTELQPHCKVGSFRSGKLILIATHSSWATPLRYFAPELRNILRTEGKLHHLITLEIRLEI
jgi:hypothetical protein